MNYKFFSLLSLTIFCACVSLSRVKKDRVSVIKDVQSNTKTYIKLSIYGTYENFHGIKERNLGEVFNKDVLNNDEKAIKENVATILNRVHKLNENINYEIINDFDSCNDICLKLNYSFLQKYSTGTYTWHWISALSVGIVPYWQNRQVLLDAELRKNGKSLKQFSYQTDYVYIQHLVLLPVALFFSEGNLKRDEVAFMEKKLITDLTEAIIER